VIWREAERLQAREGEAAIELRMRLERQAELVAERPKLAEV